MANEPLDLSRLEQVLRQGIANGLNDAADLVFGLSQQIVPRDVGDLAASGQSPATSADHEATPEDLEASITYGTPYAAAQHEGIAIQERGDQEVLWVARNYTTPGTGSHFLERPLKEEAGGGNLERDIGRAVQDELRKNYRES